MSSLVVRFWNSRFSMCLSV